MSKQDAKRKLIYIPISHSQQDMGSLGKCLPADRDYCRITAARWMEIERQVRALALDWPTVKVYQDGLPDVDPGMVAKIVATVESPNYEILRWLLSQGAAVMGTESPVMLKEEYGYLRAIVGAEAPAAKKRACQSYADRARSLLAERDAYIARRIEATLQEGEVGILFIGQAHRVMMLIPADISIWTLAGDYPSPAVS